jgi:hypothetical protein
MFFLSKTIALLGFQIFLVFLAYLMMVLAEARRALLCSSLNAANKLIY